MTPAGFIPAGVSLCGRLFARRIFIVLIGAGRRIAGIDIHTAAIIEERQDVLASLQSCLPLLARGTSSRERVAVKLLTAEIERAAWMIRARRPR